MFTVTLKNGTSFAATSVQESYNLANLFSASPWRLSLDVIPEWAKFRNSGGPGAETDVSCGGECAVYTGYTSITDIAQRLLVDGKKNLTVTLERQPENPEGAGGV
ncbi:MAG: hypothetical protein ACLRJV_17320 [Eubacteriales bacterium]